MSIQPRRRQGFTLIEILLVIAAIAILAAIVIFAVNPAETLRKSRDAQRISDLATLKAAIDVYIISTSTPYLAGTNNTACKTGAGGGTYGSGDFIYYSYPSAADITDTTLDGGTADEPAAAQAANPYEADGDGWIRINFASLAGGSPLPALPVDPVNAIGSLSSVQNTDLVYRFACNATNLTYEINAQLESEAFTVGSNDRRGRDGGDHATMYEVGSNLNILTSGSF